MKTINDDSKAMTGKLEQTTEAETKRAPLFAQTTQGKPLVIKTRIRAGAVNREESVK